VIIKDQKRNRGEAQKKTPCKVRPWDGCCVMKGEREAYGKRKIKNRE